MIRFLTFSFLATCFLLASCSSNRSNHIPSSPTEVNPKEVDSVLLLSDPKSGSVCEQSLKSQGAKILYRGPFGLLMLNKPITELNAKGCEGKSFPNQTLDLERPAKVATVRGENSIDLPTLLKLIPTEDMGAITFTNQNPTYDGRGVTVAILDTGVEIDHPMLKQTPTGENKIIDFQDFSGEGRFDLSDVTVADDGSFKSADGTIYQVKNIKGTEFGFGIFKGSTLADAEALSQQDTFNDVGVLVYLNADKKLRGRIDTNHDKNFEDEVELGNFQTTRFFTKLGEKQSLTTTLEIAPDKKQATLCFDDGSHGTHVAGITLGFDPTGGLRGVAPGAKMISAKIGDNRLSGGSTTTASMLLAIDYAASKNAQIINMSYGIRAGSNLGKSAIDTYVDAVARKKGILFSISAGNEGPGLLTVGVPAGANLAITNGAYISKKTAQDNYNYVGFDDDTIWFFSSVGPRLDGGWKPTLLAPGSALSSVPLWSGKFANYRGTSMASPETTGGLALLLSAAQQSGVSSDRASVTRAVYDSAKKVTGLSLIEQGHGLFNIPAAFEKLKAQKELPLEYVVTVASTTSPSGTGGGIYVRGKLPENLYSITIAPSPTEEQLAKGMPLRTLSLMPSAPWIVTNKNLWIQKNARVIQVDLNRSLLKTPGLYSEKITAVDDSTGQVAFEVPVTVIVPTVLDSERKYSFQSTTSIRVGQTLRYFVELPAGTTSLTTSLNSKGSQVWAQILDPEGRKMGELRDTESTVPMPTLNNYINVTRPGVYEIDVVAPANNKEPETVTLNTKAQSFTVVQTPSSTEDRIEVFIQNNFGIAKVVPQLEIKQIRKVTPVSIKGNLANLSILFNEEDQKNLSSIQLTAKTGKPVYDLMTDFPYRLFDLNKELIANGGLELESVIPITGLDKLRIGNLTLEIQGAFTQKAPISWAMELTEDRILKNSLLIKKFGRVLIESGEFKELTFILPGLPESVKGKPFCYTLTLGSPEGQTLQDNLFCPK